MTRNLTLLCLVSSFALLSAGCAGAGTTRTSAQQPSSDAVAVGGEDIDTTERDPHAPTAVVVGLRDMGTESSAMMQVEMSEQSPMLYVRTDTLEQVCDDISILFEYDSDELTAETREALDALSNCFNREEIRTIEVAGHADPRGSHGYNDELALRRARRVASYLHDQGVTEPQVEVVSHGEERARWSMHWDNDRRVDINNEPLDDHD